MSEPFLAEVRMFGFNFPPRGYAFCDGQILPIAQNQSLYSLLGTTFGGDGRTTFALPDLRGRVPLHVGQSSGGADHALGSRSGEEGHTLNEGEIPAHSHAFNTHSGNGNTPVADGNFLASFANGYIDPSAGASGLVPLRPDSMSNAGAGQPANNMQPSLVIAFAIALQGLFPSRN